MNLALELSESEAKIVLEALAARERQMAETCATSEDEDLVAEVGNDLIELRLLLNELRTAATSKFGPGVLKMSREPL
jgi:hypothetical protein